MSKKPWEDAPIVQAASPKKPWDSAPIVQAAAPPQAQGPQESFGLQSFFPKRQALLEQTPDAGFIDRVRATGGDILSSPRRAFGAAVEGVEGAVQTGAGLVSGTLFGGLEEGRRRAKEELGEAGQEILRETNRARPESFLQGIADQAPALLAPIPGARERLASTAGKGLMVRLGGLSREGVVQALPGASAQAVTQDSQSGLAELGAGAALGPLAPAAGTLAKGAMKGGKALVSGGAKIGAKAVDLMTGSTITSDIVEGAGKGLREFVERKGELSRQILNPRRAGDFDELSEIARKHGIDPQSLPAAIEFGELSVPARAQKVQAQGPEGQRILERYEDAAQSVRDAFDQQVAKIGGGTPVTASDGGEILKEGIRGGLQRLNEKITTSHDQIVRLVPGLKLYPQDQKTIESALTSLERFAKGRSQRGIDPTQRSSAQTLLNAVDAVRNSNMSYKQINEAREMIGEVAFDKIGSMEKIGTHDQKLRDLYFALNDAMMGTVEKLDVMRTSQFNDALLPQLKESNEIVTQAMRDKGVLTQALGDFKKAPEKVFQAALGDSRKAQALKNLLSSEELQQVKAAFIESLIKRDPSENFTFRSLANAMRSKKEVINELFTPDEALQLGEVMRLGDRLGAPLLPGSAGQLDFRVDGMRGGPIDAAFRAVTEPLGDIQRNIGMQRARNKGGQPLREEALRSTRRTLAPLPRATIRRGLANGLNPDEGTRR